MLRRWAGLLVGTAQRPPVQSTVPEVADLDETVNCPPSISCTEVAGADDTSHSVVHDSDENTLSSDDDSPERPIVQVRCSGEGVMKGAVFSTLSQAKEACTRFAQCPVKQSSTKKLKYVTFSCFRSGSPSQSQSKVDEEFQRKKWSSRIQCPFIIRLKKNESLDVFEVTDLSDTHNHELYAEEEIQQLPQNRFIPEEVKDRILSLNSHGILKCDQIMCLIENDYFPELQVTWTKRDVQNLLQQHVNRKLETHNFVSLLHRKCADGWQINIHHNEETLRLERILWISKTGLEQYLLFSDVLEIDATYKTNR